LENDKVTVAHTVTVTSVYMVCSWVPACIVRPCM